MSLRPEALALDPAATPGPAANAFDACLAESNYQGEMTEHRVAVGETLSLRLLELNPRGVFKPGDRVRLRVHPADVVVLAGS